MKNIYRKINRKKYSFGELVEVINSCSRNSKEATAALIDLLSSGRVCMETANGQRKRVQVAAS